MENQEGSGSLTLGKAELGLELGISARTVAWKLQNAPEELPPCIRLGRRVFWLRCTVETWLKAQEVKQRFSNDPLGEAFANLAAFTRAEAAAAPVKREPGRPRRPMVEGRQGGAS